MARDKKRLSERDTERALSVIEGHPRERKPQRRRRCGFCGYLYDYDDLYPDTDEEGRQIGVICGSCI